MREYVGVVGGQRLEFVGSTGEAKLRDFGNVSGERLGEFRLRIEPGADSGAALRQRIQMIHPDTQPRDAALDLGGVAGELLTERQRCGVLGMGAADLDDVSERVFLFA